MALIKCEECGQEISDKATTCPSCGCPIVKRPIASNKIFLSCPNCSKPLMASEEVAGETVDCPKCGGTVLVPGQKSTTQSSNISPSGNQIGQRLKSCSECGNKVAIDADTCPYCGTPNPALSANTKATLVIIAIIIMFFLWWAFCTPIFH